MFELGLEFANIEREDCTAPKMLRIFATHGIYFTKKGQQDGFEQWFYYNCMHIALINDCAFINDIRSKQNTVRLRETTAIPSDSWYDESLWEAVSTVQSQLRAFYDEAIKYDRIPIDTVRAIYNDLKPPVYISGSTEDPWQVEIGIDCRRNNLLELILSQEIVEPIYKGLGREFQRIRRCPKCGRYFYAKDIRKLFCSTKCKNAHMYLQRKENQ